MTTVQTQGLLNARERMLRASVQLSVNLNLHVSVKLPTVAFTMMCLTVLSKKRHTALNTFTVVATYIK